GKIWNRSVSACVNLLERSIAILLIQQHDLHSLRNAFLLRHQDRQFQAAFGLASGGVELLPVIPQIDLTRLHRCLLRSWMSHSYDVRSRRYSRHFTYTRRTASFARQIVFAVENPLCQHRRGKSMLGLVIGNPEEYAQRRHCRDMYLNLGMVSAFHVNWRSGISLGSSATVSCGEGHIQRSLDARCRTAGAAPGINDALTAYH